MTATPHPDATPMDRRDLQPCAVCGKGVLHTGTPVFYEMSIGACVADVSSIRQQHGLEMMLGGAAPLATALAPSTTVAHRLPSVRLLLCSDCALLSTPPLTFLETGDE